jgi:hypothetical protein
MIITMVKRYPPRSSPKLIWDRGVWSPGFMFRQLICVCVCVRAWFTLPSVGQGCHCKVEAGKVHIRYVDHMICHTTDA